MNLSRVIFGPDTPGKCEVCADSYVQLAKANRVLIEPDGVVVSHQVDFAYRRITYTAKLLDAKREERAMFVLKSLKDLGLPNIFVVLAGHEVFYECVRSREIGEFTLPVRRMSHKPAGC